MSLKYYCTKFANLNVDTAHIKTKGTPAPHQPILLMSIIELIKRKKIQHNQIFFSKELKDAFRRAWELFVNSSYNRHIQLPFYHLHRNGFWHFKPNPGYEARLLSGNKIRSVKELQEVINYAYLDEELFALLRQHESREILMNTLIDTWFLDNSRIDDFALTQQKLQKIHREKLSQQDLEDEGVTFVRNRAFRRLLVAVYEQRCAFCSLQILDSLGQNIVDGAHIKPFSQFFDDRIDNGLALCKNHHWAFDCGWFSVDNDYTILVADLQEDSPNARPMRDYKGSRILLPSHSQYYPRLEALRWHRENVFGEA